MSELTLSARSPDRRRVRSIYPVVLVALLVGLAVPYLLRRPADWDNVYLPAAVRLRTGEDIFQYGYVYPPAAAWFASPCAYLSPFGSRLVWYLASAASLVMLLHGAWRLSGGNELPGTEGVPRCEHMILFAGLACGVYFIVDCLSNRQNDLLVAALVILGCLRLSAGRAFSAGVLFGVAAGLKCTPLLWAPYLAWRRQYLASTVVIAVALAVNLAPDLTHPAPTGNRLVQWATRYLSLIAQKDRDPGIWASAIQFNHSIAGVGNRLLTAERTVRDGRSEAVMSAARISPMTLKAIVYGVCGVLVVIAMLTAGRTRHRSDMAGLEYCLVLLLMLLLSPMSSKPHFCTLVLPGFCLARRVVERGDRVSACLLVTAVVLGLLSNKDLWGARVYDFALWYGSVCGAAVVLFFGCAYALWRDRWTAVAKLLGDRPEAEATERRRAA